MSPLKEQTNGRLYEILVNLNKNGLLPIAITLIICSVFYKWIDDAKKNQQIQLDQSIKSLDRAYKELSNCNQNTIKILQDQLDKNTRILEETSDVNREILKELERN